MAYININEYDYTINRSTALPANTVVVPINATDGPSEKWTLITSYDQFIQTFGPNPGISSYTDAGIAFGNSWEYAANLLLRGMSVLVRRITHKLDEYGNNTTNFDLNGRGGPLPGLKTATSTIALPTGDTYDQDDSHITLGVNDEFSIEPITRDLLPNQIPNVNIISQNKVFMFTNDNTNDNVTNLTTDKLDSYDSNINPYINYGLLDQKIESENNNKVVIVFPSGGTNLYSIQILKPRMDSGQDFVYTIDREFKLTKTGKIDISNNGNGSFIAIDTSYSDSDESIFNEVKKSISSFEQNIVVNRTTKLDSMIHNDSNLRNPYLHLPSYTKIILDLGENGDYFIKINASVENNNTQCPILTFYLPDDNIQHTSFGYIELQNGSSLVTKYMQSNIPSSYNGQTLNMFNVKYKYPGSNGNNIKLLLREINKQGLYLYVYRNNQFLERIELIAYKEKNEITKKVVLKDKNKPNDAIYLLKQFLTKFKIPFKSDNITIENSQKYTQGSDIYSIKGNNIVVTLNTNDLVPSDTSIKKILNEGLQNESTVINDPFDWFTNILLNTENDTYPFTPEPLKNGQDVLDIDVAHEVVNVYKPLLDKYKYDFSFVSNGGYVDSQRTDAELDIEEEETRVIEDSMLEVVNERKDCVTYLDIPYSLGFEDIPFYFESISNSYAAAYAPWCLINLSTGGTRWMPGSFVQLYTHAKSIGNGNKMYLPPAGVRRASVPEIVDVKDDLPSSLIKTWQDGSANQYVNPILYINGYDYTIYGQKTLYNIVGESNKYTSALQDLNVRLVANAVKKCIFKACIDLTFELNGLKLWNEFKSKVSPLLSEMLGEGTLTYYNLIMDSSTMTKADLNSGHVVGVVKIAVATAATDWDINVEIQPNDITIYESDYNSLYVE